MQSMHISGGGLGTGAQLPPRAQHRRPSASQERGGGGHSNQSDHPSAYPSSSSDRDRPRVSQHSSRRVIIGGAGNPVAPSYSPSWSPVASSQHTHDWPTSAAAAAAARPVPPAVPSDLYNGRATPDPPKGSYRLQPHEQVSHPPTAPPAQQRQPRPPPQPRNSHANGGGHGSAAHPPPPLLQSHTPRIMFESKQTANGPSQNDSGRDPRPPPHHQPTQLLRRPSGDRDAGGNSSRITPFQPNGLSQALQYSAERRGSGDRGALAGILSAAQINAQPQQQQHHAPSPAQHNAPQPAGRGSLQQTIQSARSSAYSQLTLQPPSAASGASSSAAGSAVHSRHLSNSPSPNSTPVKPVYSSRDRHAFDKLHVFDQSPLATPKEMVAARGAAAAFARAPSGSQDEQGQHHRIISEGQRRRAMSNAPQVALSWPSEVSANALAAVSGRSNISVRASQPLPSPSTTAAASSSAASSASAGRNFPAILKRGAQLIQEKPPVLSPARALELQLDEYDVEDYGNDLSMGLSDDDDDDDDDRRGRFKDMPPQPDFSAAAFTIHGHAPGSGNGAAAAAGNQNRNSGAKNGRIGSASSGTRVGSASHKKNNSGSQANSGSGSGSGSSLGSTTSSNGPAGMKKLDVASAQAFRSPYTRKSFASRDGPKPSARSGSKGSGDFLPAEEWVLGPSSDEESEAAGGDTDHSSSGGGSGGWILDVGMAEDANPRFRASMEDAHVIRRKFGPRFIVESTTAAAEKKETDSAAAAAASGAAALSAPRGSFFSVFDGHGGRGTVDFLAAHFHRELARCITAAAGAPNRNASPSEVQRAIETACAKIDGSMAPHSTANRVYGDAFQDCGSTACFVYLRPCGPKGQGREVFFSNVGDAQAVLAVDKQALQRGQIAAGSGGTAGSAADRKAKRASGTNNNNNGPLSPQSSPAQPASHTDRTPKKSKHRAVDSTSSAATDTKSARGSGAAASSSSSPLAKTIARGASTASASSSRSASGAPPKLTALAMSYPHVATDPKEIARIKAGGGVVFASQFAGGRMHAALCPRCTVVVAHAHCSLVLCCCCSDRVGGCLAVSGAR